MTSLTTSLARKLGNRLFIYFGSAWLLVEVFNFVIDRYSLDPVFLDFLILIVVFGLPATLIHYFFKGRFNKIAVGFQTLNVIGTIIVLIYFLLHPLSLNPGKLRIIKLYEG